MNLADYWNFINYRGPRAGSMRTSRKQKARRHKRPSVIPLSSM